MVVTDLEKVAGIAAGGSNTCTVQDDGAARCWGSNSYGQVGDGTTTNASNTVAVSSLTGAAEICAGGNGGCAVQGEGAVLCWGYNNYGQVGDGTTTQRLTPVAASGLGTLAP